VVFSDCVFLFLLEKVIFLDINCTHNCFYQRHGKCDLKELPAYSRQAVNGNNTTDCPYYADSAVADGASGVVNYPNIIA